MGRRKLLLGAVAGHLLLTALHGAVHATIPVVPTGLTAAVAVVALYLLPIVGTGLSVRGRPRAGAVVLLSAGVASFVFEGLLHFLLGNPDHVAGHHLSFGVTAVLTTAGNLLLVWAAWLSVREGWDPVNGVRHFRRVAHRLFG